MIRRVFGPVCLATLLLLANTALAQEFSADVVSNKHGNEAPGKLYATKDKVRWEMQERDPRMGQVALIIDEGQARSFALLEQKHMYLDSMPWMTKSPIITQFWHVQDVGDACPQWKKIAEQLKTDQEWGSCSKVGSETVNGRSAVKYEGVSKKGDKTYYWIDNKLKCVIKSDNGSGSFELRNIQEGSQPSSLFEVPAGYTKLDMGTMMQQHQ